MHDLVLAILHHLLFLGLIVMLASELALLRTPEPPVKRLAGLDAGYGVTALLIILVGVGRVMGGKGWAFYEANPFFWAKIATFALIGLISIRPTLLILKWRKAAKSAPGYVPPQGELTAARRAIGLEILLLIPLLAFAAAMARWPF
ncbi:DUF2214 family protein [Brevundimonas naejangsanensis]|uniref:DUF2214 family protein n=1 Tax=Brevundimonas naejangsanensis TaxID=588932 RepID=UPI0026ED82CB|nr:DUF2214 family protein [Brevundimonas naejangsanensis]